MLIRALSFIAFFTFWNGVFGIVREWRYSRKHGLAITLVEKIYLVSMVPVIVGLAFLVDLAGIPVEINGSATLLAILVAVNAWPVLRRVGRA